MEDAVTGQLLSTFNKTSGPMLGWGTAIECNDNNGVSCTGTISKQYYVNSTIILESADNTFIDTLGAGTGVTHTEMVTSDNGKTWTIAKINIPAMQSSSASAVAAVAVQSSSAAASVIASSSQIAVATTSIQAFATGSGDPVIVTATISSIQVAPSAILADISAAPTSSTTTQKAKHHGHTSKHSGA